MFEKVISDLKEIGATDLEIEQFTLFLGSIEKLINLKKDKFNRVLPLGDYIFDRWEKANFNNFSKGANIHDNTIIIGDVEVGENTWIGPNVMLEGVKKLKIGAYCSISAGCQIYTHNSVMWALTGGEFKDYEYAPTTIEDNCYLGPNVIVEKGITIGKCSIIGANSFVNKDIPPFSKAFGTPIKVVGSTKELIDNFLKDKK